MNLSDFRTQTVGSILVLLTTLVVDVYPQASRLTKSPTPEPVSFNGYKGHCASLPTAIRLCKVLSDGEDIFLIEKDGKRIGAWPTSAYLGETSDFEVFRGDLDGDGRLEVIVSNHDTSSAGMGVNYWTIAILPDVESSPFEFPLTFRVEEYGSLGTFVSARRSVSILATKWLWSTDPKGKKSRGLYLVGQWWKYKSGQLVPLLNKRTVMRRYLLSFERERLQTIDSPRAPYRWLIHPHAIPIGRELETTRLENTQSGIIESVSSAADKDFVRVATLTFKPDNQSSVTYVYPGDSEMSGNQLRYIGDVASGRLYPNRYLPTQPETWLRGKRATVRTYRETADAESFRVLWIER